MKTVEAPAGMSGQAIVDLARQHTLYEWSAQSTVDPIPVAGAKGCWFWTPEGKRYLDFNSQLMCVNIGHGDERVLRAMQAQAQKVTYIYPGMATEARARLGAKLAEITPGDIETTRLNVSPKLMPNESEYDAPSENPATAMRARSMRHKPEILPTAAAM